MGKHKRNIIIISTVTGTIILAPLVAALAVGIGVPILLAYVYGVVPISLCRSGGCGVTKNNNGGVRFAFDEENTDNMNFYSYSGNNNNNQASSISNLAINNLTSNNNENKKSTKKDEEINNSTILTEMSSVKVNIFRTSLVEINPD